MAWQANDPFAQSAIIAYYTLFSLPSLLLIITSTVGYFVGQEKVSFRITSQIENYIGQGAAEAVSTMLTNAKFAGDHWITVVISIAALLYGATGVFFQMKKTMNTIWNVREKKESFYRLLINRAISFGMILVIGFMLLVSLVISAGLQALSEYIENFAPLVASAFADIGKILLSFLFIGSLFAALFKLLPDVKMSYRTTFLGAGITTLLFLAGEYILGYYFAKSSPTSIYGGAASVVLILLWVNYTCLILFFGVEITVQYALAKKQKIEPTRNAELAYFQEMEELREQIKKTKENKKKAEILKENPSA